MEEARIALALGRAGYGSLEEFRQAKGLSTTEAAKQALTPWLLGYDLYRVKAGDTLWTIAGEAGTSVKTLRVANPHVEPENLRAGAVLTVPFDFDVVPTDTPMTSELLGDVLRGLRARYPFLQTETVGKSLWGRPLWQIRMGRGSRVVCYNGAHHANEWITTPLLLTCVERYAKAAAFGENLLDRDAEKLMRETTLYVFPMVNPDGVDLVTGGAAAEEIAVARSIGEGFPDIPFPQGWKANARGVDLNLNYPAGWDEAKTIKFGQGYDRPSPRDYVGDAPLSEPESRAMFDVTEKLDPQITVSWHTQGREIYWKYLDMKPMGAETLGRQMALESGYRLEEVPYVSGFAGYKDWFIQDFDRPGYTVEAGAGENPLPLGDLNRMVEENLPIFLLGLTGAEETAEPAWG